MELFLCAPMYCSVQNSGRVRVDLLVLLLTRAMFSKLTTEKVCCLSWNVSGGIWEVIVTSRPTQAITKD